MKQYTPVFIWLFDASASWLAGIAGLTDWSLFGWAFAASTGFVVYEITQRPPIKRSLGERAGMVGLGLLISLGLNGWVSDITHIPIVPVTLLLGGGGYKLYGRFLKKTETATSIDDLTSTKD